MEISLKKMNKLFNLPFDVSTVTKSDKTNFEKNLEQKD